MAAPTTGTLTHQYLFNIWMPILQDVFFYLTPKNFQRPKNRKGGSDFDDFRTKSIASTRPKHGKVFERTSSSSWHRRRRHRLRRRRRRRRREILGSLY